MPSVGSPVQYAKRVVGRKMYGGQSTHLPMKVNMSGVMPIIFAQSIASIPRPSRLSPARLTAGSTPGSVPTPSLCSIYFLLIIFFAYFYSTIQFNPIEGGQQPEEERRLHPRLPSGQADQRVHQKVLNKITLFGALSRHHRRCPPFSLLTSASPHPSRVCPLGGTSIIIVVGVALETVRARKHRCSCATIRVP